MFFGFLLAWFLKPVKGYKEGNLKDTVQQHLPGPSSLITIMIRGTNMKEQAEVISELSGGVFRSMLQN